MHAESMRLMREFIEAERAKATKPLSVLDVGSYDVNGCYKSLIPPEWRYVGLDMVEGPNVDIVAKDPYQWRFPTSQRFDIVISGQCLEHVEYPWLTMVQIHKALKVGGRCCIIVPSKGREHRYPVDCYRYLPDGMAALTRWAGLTVVSIKRHEANAWGDLVTIAEKRK